MSDRKCPRVRPSRRARTKDWVTSGFLELIRFTQFVRIDVPIMRIDGWPNRDGGAYPNQKDADYARSDR